MCALQGAISFQMKYVPQPWYLWRARGPRNTNVLITAILDTIFFPMLSLQASPPLAEDTGRVLHSSETMCLATRYVHFKQILTAG